MVLFGSRSWTDMRLMESTLPVMPPTSIMSPRLICFSPTRKRPLMMLDREVWEAKPTATPMMLAAPSRVRMSNPIRAKASTPMMM